MSPTETDQSTSHRRSDSDEDEQSEACGKTTSLLGANNYLDARSFSVASRPPRKKTN